MYDAGYPEPEASPTNFYIMTDTKKPNPYRMGSVEFRVTDYGGYDASPDEWPAALRRAAGIKDEPEGGFSDNDPKLRPAVRQKDTGKIFTGIAGIHGNDTIFENGFVNHKGQFLNRQRAMDYAWEHDLIPRWAQQYATPGTELTSEMLHPGRDYGFSEPATKPPTFTRIKAP